MVEEWDNLRQEIIGNSEDVRILNNRLLKIISNINDVYSQLEAGREDFDVCSIKERITGTKSKDYFIELFETTISLIEKKLGKGYSIVH